MARESQNEHPFPAESSGTQKVRIKQNPKGCGTPTGSGRAQERLSASRHCDYILKEIPYK
jgi:hypothetical protein